MDLALAAYLMANPEARPSQTGILELMTWLKNQEDKTPATGELELHDALKLLLSFDIDEHGDRQIVVDYDKHEAAIKKAVAALANSGVQTMSLPWRNPEEAEHCMRSIRTLIEDMYEFSVTYEGEGMSNAVVVNWKEKK